MASPFSVLAITSLGLEWSLKDVLVPCLGSEAMEERIRNEVRGDRLSPPWL